MRDETAGGAGSEDPIARLFTLQEAADRFGLSAPVLRFYLHKYAASLGIPRIGSGEPLLTEEQLAQLRDLYEVGIYRAPVVPSNQASSAECDEDGSSRDQGKGEGEAQGLDVPGEETAEGVQVRLLDMTHAWIEEMDQRLDHRLDELTRTIDFLAEENRELQVLLSRILTTITPKSDGEEPEESRAESEAESVLSPDLDDDRDDRDGSAHPASPDEEPDRAVAAADSTVAAAHADNEELSPAVPDPDLATTPDGNAETESVPADEELSDMHGPELTAVPDEQTYSPVPAIRKEHPASAIRREEEAEDWSPAEL